MSEPVDSESGGALPPDESTVVHTSVQLQGPPFLSCLAVGSLTPAYRSESTETSHITSVITDILNTFIFYFV